MSNKQKLLVFVAVFAIVMVSCSFMNFDRGEDGNLRVETNLSLDLIQSAIELSAEFDQMVGLALEPRDGYIYVHADTVEIQGVTAQDVSFHLELGAVDGQLTANITNVQINNSAFDTSKFEGYNQIVADSLGQISDMTDRATLESVDVTPDGVKMVWILNTSSGN